MTVLRRSRPLLLYHLEEEKINLTSLHLHGCFKAQIKGIRKQKQSKALNTSGSLNANWERIKSPCGAVEIRPTPLMTVLAIKAGLAMLHKLPSVFMDLFEFKILSKPGTVLSSGTERQ